MEPGSSLPHSQVPATCPYPEPARTKILVQVRGFLCEHFVTWYVLRQEVLSILPNPQAGGPLLVGYPHLLIQYIRSYPLYWRSFLHPQPEDVPYRGDKHSYLSPYHRRHVSSAGYILLTEHNWRHETQETSVWFLKEHCQCDAARHRQLEYG